MATKNHSNDWNEVKGIIESADEFDDIRLYNYFHNEAGYKHVDTRPHRPDQLGTDVTEETFCSIAVKRYPHPYRLQGVEAAMWCAERQIELNYTRVHTIGFRAGEKDGVASERMEDGSFEVAEYGVLGHADGRYPYGTKRVVVRRYAQS